MTGPNLSPKTTGRRAGGGPARSQRGLDELAELTWRHREVDELTDTLVRVMHRKVLHSDDTLLLAMRWIP
ncbi:hypothetical protein [Nonomuraea sp. NPDC049784]|uniref:hypothetical protein n=1 Tax=Nonomuraea sp. NPDC049784 TaxID=3154361 RepID=UPI003410B164